MAWVKRRIVMKNTVMRIFILIMSFNGAVCQQAINAGIGDAIKKKAQKFRKNLETSVAEVSGLVKKSVSKPKKVSLDTKIKTQKACVGAPGNGFVTIKDKKVIKSDQEKLIPAIAKYAPVLYFHPQETGFPVVPKGYFYSKRSRIIDHNKNVVVSADKVTPKKVYDFYKKYKSKKEAAPIRFEVDKCVEAGSDLRKWRQGESVNHPVYVVTFEHKEKIHVQYLLLFGVNRAYKPFSPWSEKFFSAITKLKSVKKELEKSSVLNKHQCDLEHFTVVLNKKTLKPEKYFFSSHGKTEGFWLSADHSEVEYEGTHPVVYLAKGGHGTYNKEGVYMRIHGIANDETAKGIRWIPQLVRVYDINDNRFDIETMSWLFFPGKYSPKTDSAVNQAWFMKGEEDRGRPYREAMKHYVPYGKPVPVVKKAIQAKPPR